MAVKSSLHPLQPTGNLWRSRTTSTFNTLGWLGLIAVLSWQAQTAFAVLAPLVSLAAIFFLWKSLKNVRYIQWGSFKMVMKDDPAA